MLEYKHLTPDQITHFLTHGYVKIPCAFTREKASAWTAQLWPRLGYSSTDRSTWLQDRVNMPAHNRMNVREFSPKACVAIRELLGGEDRVDENSCNFSDGFIVNLGKPEWEGRKTDPRELDNWHVDGDFFVHFLDSPEQGLLIIPIFSDIAEGGGGTMIATDGIRVIAEHLRDHPGASRRE